MIHILYVLNNAFNYGGTEAVVLNYYKHLDSEIRVDFAVHATEEEYSNSALTQELLKDGTKIYRITPRKESIRRNNRELYNVMRKQYDIVHTHTDAVGAHILRIAKRCGIPYRIAHSHSTNFPIKADSIKNTVKLLYLNYCRSMIVKYATDYMACSRAAAQWLFRNTAEKAYILNNAIDAEKFAFCPEIRNQSRKKLGLEDTYVIGNIGRLEYIKNQEFLIKCFKSIYAKKPSARLLLVGEGPDRKKLEDLTEKQKLTGKVIFYGVSEKTWEILNVMDVFAFPSLHEGLSVALLEAQANGLRCFVNDSVLITKESDVTGQISWVGIERPERWVVELINEHGERCHDSVEKIKNSGYSIKEEAKKLSQYYREMVLGQKEKTKHGE